MGEALVGCPFPDFSMEIVGNHPSQGNGEHMRLTDLTSNGRPTLLQFYACKRRTLLHDATVSKRRIFTHGPVLVPNPCHTMCYPTRAGSTGPPPPLPPCTRQATPLPVRGTSKRHSLPLQLTLTPQSNRSSPATRYSFLPSALTTLVYPRPQIAW